MACGYDVCGGVVSFVRKLCSQYKSDISPRENMQIIREKVKSFIENFDDPQEKNLLFTGNTGLGKTFLTNCIANELLKQGKTVLYQTAPVMLDSILDFRFGKNNNFKCSQVLSLTAANIYLKHRGPMQAKLRINQL